MSNLSEPSQTLSLRALVKRLLEEHRDFSSKVHILNESIDDFELSKISKVFVPFREALIEHMLVEESEIFPEVSRLGFFDERISEIMQQHVDITAALDEFRFSMHRKNLQDIKNAFDELVRLMNIHFPAEEKEVFMLIN